MIFRYQVVYYEHDNPHVLSRHLTATAAERRLFDLEREARADSPLFIPPYSRRYYVMDRLEDRVYVPVPYY